jgi:CheY-like chemotaxis protein
VKADPNLKVIPAVVLTTSQSEEDGLKSYNLGDNRFITKPLAMERRMPEIAVDEPRPQKRGGMVHPQ